MPNARREGQTFHLGIGHIHFVLFLVLDSLISEMVYKAPGGFAVFSGMSFIVDPPFHHLVSPPTEVLVSGDGLHDPLVVFNQKVLIRFGAEGYLLPGVFGEVGLEGGAAEHCQDIFEVRSFVHSVLHHFPVRSF